VTHRSKSEPAPNRGEIWWIRFDPTQGAEIGKTRPATVVSVPSVGRLPLRIVVPITEWNPRWVTVPWLVFLKKAKFLKIADRFGVARTAGRTGVSAWSLYRWLRDRALARSSGDSDGTRALGHLTTSGPIDRQVETSPTR